MATIVTTNALTDQHRAMLRDGSGICERIIEQRGYYSIVEPKQAESLGFARNQALTISERHPALIIPYYNPYGDIETYCMRPDNPRIVENKKNGRAADGTYPQRVIKYEMIRGAGNVLDCHPAITAALSDPGRAVVFTEGAKKADALISRGYAAVNVNGVWGWRGSNDHQGRAALPDFEAIALNGRRCVLAFDSDVRDNPNVRSALRRFRSFLQSRRAAVIPVILPASNGDKIGIDDFFAAGSTAADFDELIAYWELVGADLGDGSSGRRSWTTEQHHDLFIEWGCRFAINDMNERIEVNGELLDDTRLDIIEARLRDERVPVDHAKKSITVVASGNRYHPIKNYLSSLAWDGQDNITTLCRHIADEENVIDVWLRRWLIGAVARVLEPDRGRDAPNFVLVFDGKQGIGKSHLAKWLCPLPAYFLESAIRPDDKDSVINLINYWMWEVGELGAVTRRADVEALKQFITRRRVSERLPYGRMPVDKPAIASFIGTVNNPGGGFLTDTTGNRRFAVCTLTAVNWDYTRLDVNQIWAQAHALYQAGESWELTSDEARRRDEINARYQAVEPIEDLLFDRFIVDPSRADDRTWQMTGAAILAALGMRPDDRGAAGRLAGILRSAGISQTNPIPNGTGKKARFWRGVMPVIATD